MKCGNVMNELARYTHTQTYKLISSKQTNKNLKFCNFFVVVWYYTTNIIHKIFSEVAIYKKTLHKSTSQLLIIVLW